MKQTLIILGAIALITYNCIAQIAVVDSVILGPNYVNQSYYSLSSGETANVSGSNWDLAFALEGFSASIRTNDGAGVILYELVDSDTANWLSVDTAGMTPLYNSDTTWDEGAFNDLATGHPDYGWGFYSPPGNLQGVKIFVIKIVNGAYRKIWIKKLDAGINYSIIAANLDNSDPHTFTINKPNYPDKTFIYYSLVDRQIVDNEPFATQWDFVFRRYLTTVQGGVYYPVTGALLNLGINAAEARGIDIESVDSETLPYNSNISVIGHDWKDYDITIPQWVLEDSLAYFIQSSTGTIYRVVFTNFEGAASGKIVFSKKMIDHSTGIASNSLSRTRLTVYPNPSNKRTNFIVSSKDHREIQLRIVDIKGVLMLKSTLKMKPGINNYSLDVSNYKEGSYFIFVDDGQGTIQQKLIVIAP